MNVKLRTRVSEGFKVKKGDLIVFKSGEEVLVTGGVDYGYRGVSLTDMRSVDWYECMSNFLDHVVERFGEVDYIVYADNLELVEVK